MPSSPVSPMSRRAFAALSLAAGVAACGRGRGSGQAGGAGGAPVRIEVDAAQVLGPFTTLSGVQGSPYPMVSDGEDLTAQFREAGIENCRFPQDCDPNTLTLGGIFPEEDADPDRPESYRFDGIDRHMAAARAAGARVLWQSSYDVGRSDAWVGRNLGGRPPSNLLRWERVLTRCLEHFNQGWASGFHGAVAHVEFLNEPDGLGGFRGPEASRWLGVFLAFLALIERYNQAHPKGQVQAVGPGIPLSIAEWPAWEPTFSELCDRVRAAGRHMPVFSFHTYGRDVSPVANERLARALRGLLDRKGMGATELWNTEWQAGDFLRAHLGVDQERARRATLQERAAFAVGMATYAISCKLRWQGLVSGSYYYLAGKRAFPPGHGPLFADPASRAGYFVSPTGGPGALGLHDRLMGIAGKAFSRRCRAQADADDGLTVGGLVAQDGREAAVMLCNLIPEPRRVLVRLRGLAGARAGSALTLGGAMEGLTSRSVQAQPETDGSVTFSVLVPAFSTEFVRIGATD